MAARMLLGPGTNAAKEQTKLPEVLHLNLSDFNSRVPISNVEVKNTDSC